MIAVIGTKKAPIHVREALLKVFSSLYESSRESSVLLHTCHRVEWYFFSKTPSNIHEEAFYAIRKRLPEEYLYYLSTFFGAECFRHLHRVVSGLDSPYLGETEIQGQVKDAYEEARKSGLSSKELHFLFQKALHAGKIIRKSILPSECLEHEVAKAISNVDEVLFVGASTINKKIARLIKNTKKITFANRTHALAEELAYELQGSVLPWEKLSSWTTFPCVVTATKSKSFLLEKQEEPSFSQLLIDLSLPRNIDPTLSSKKRTILNIESFLPKEKTLSEQAKKAEEKLDEMAFSYYSTLETFTI